MITFKQFLLEGGNVVIDDQEAQRIDLKKLSRAEVLPVIEKLLLAINLGFKKHTGKPLWSNELFQSKAFLSGSAFHFFNSKIPDSTFTKYKSTVGDIDTQVDKAAEAEIKSFLNDSKGQKFGPGIFVGYKSSAGQFITLWKLQQLGINVQIDLEMVDFENELPTEWSQFSHSSAWEDMTKGVKGVAHKYLLRALDAPKLKDIVLKAKTAKGKDKEVKSSETAFSVTHGVRTKLKPVLDSAGKQVMVNGKPAYHELSTAESKGDTNLSSIFKAYFKVQPTKADLKKMSSFTGLIELIKTHFSKADQQKIADGFARTLWGPGAQGLYRGDAEKDKEEKNAMLNILLSELNLKNKYQAEQEEFYKNYK
jgi:hypothetical protein